VEAPNVLQAVAGALERLGRFREAVATYDRWLEVAPADAPNRHEIERMRQVDLERIARLRLTVSPADARLTVDGVERTEDTAEATRELPLDPGAHRVEARAEGHEPATIQVTLSAGEQAQRELILVERAGDAEPSPIVESPRAPASAPREDPFPVGWVVAGAGGGLTVVGAVLLGVGAADWTAVDGAVDQEWTELEGAHGRAGPLLVSGAIVAGVGLAALVLGVVIAVGGDDDEVALRVGPTGLALRGRLP